MAQLTDQQIAQFAAGAGFTGPDLDTAIAVALAESGGNSSNIGDVNLQNATFGPSVGLWQIRSVNPGYGNAFDQAHRNQQANMDPATNAANAYAIQQHYGWNQWSTYTGGQYRQYLDRARAAHSGDQTTTPTDQLQQTPTQQQTPQQNGQGSSNSQGFLGELEKLMESVGKLMNPADKLSKASQQAQRAAASGQAFGKVQGSSQAHQTHVSNTQKYGQHASKGSERVRTHSDDIKCTATDYQNFSNQGAQSIDQTAAPVREDMINPPIPSNLA
jgi:hypothetical protein